MSNILFFPTHILWTPHYETELELIQNHLNEGDNVIQAVCNGELQVCDSNLKHSMLKCVYCISKRYRGMELLVGESRTIPIFNLSEDNIKEIALLKVNFADLEELKGYRIDNFDVGYAVASSLISLLRDPCISMPAHKNLVASYIVSAMRVYRSVQNCLDKMKIDRLYVFNGRFAYTRAIFRACQSRHTECVIHERGHGIAHYELYANSLPHDLGNIERRVRETWAKAESMTDRGEIGAKFYLDRARGVDQSWYSFVKNQSKCLLPDTWSADINNIVIFNSSEDEFASLGDEWKNPLYPDQLTALKKIIESLEQEKDQQFHVYLRMHPNNKGMAIKELQKWYELGSNILSVIRHDSPIDTYALLKSANKVLTFGSTVGVEAVFWGKPSVLAGLSPYRNLGVTYNPSSHGELVRLLMTTLEPMDKLPAIMYGYYWNTYGIPFKYYKAEGFGCGKFKGIDLDRPGTNQRIVRYLTVLKSLTKVMENRYFKCRK